MAAVPAAVAPRPANIMPAVSGDIDRSTGIGASEAAAAINMNRYHSAAEVYAEKVAGRIADKDTGPQYWGKKLEPFIFDRYITDTRLEAVLHPKSTRSPEFPFMFASPDAVAADRVIDLKTAGARNIDEWGEPGTDEVPQEYLIQVVHQMIVCGKRKADIAVLLAGQDFRVYNIDLDDELAELVVERERAFWHLVETRTPPADTTSEEFGRIYRRSNARMVQATEGVLETCGALARVKATIKELESQKDGLEAVIKSHLTDADTLVEPASGLVLATWKSTKDGTEFDMDTFKAEHPDLYKAFLKPKPGQRRFLLKK